MYILINGRNDLLFILCVGNIARKLCKCVNTDTSMLMYV